MKKAITILLILAASFLLFFMVIFMLLVVGLYITDDTTPDNTESVYEQNIQPPKAEIKELSIETLINRENELVFSFSINDFIDSYNGYYWEDKKSIYLTPADKWQVCEYDAAIHSNHRTLYYYFKGNYNNWVLPSISVYVPENADYVQEITVNFDDYHSYREEMYELYEEMCFYTIKVFFNDLSDEKIIELYKALNKLAYDNVFPNEKGYANNPTPCALYYKDGIGLYPYFAIGQSVRLCVIPVTEQTINEFKRKGVEVYEISEN